MGWGGGKQTGFCGLYFFSFLYKRFTVLVFSSNLFDLTSLEGLVFSCCCCCMCVKGQREGWKAREEENDKTRCKDGMREKGGKGNSSRRAKTKSIRTKCK